MTEIETQVEELNAAMKEFDLRAANIKANFEKCIVNPDVSLDLRWNLFMRADNKLKNHGGWIEHFPGSGLDDLIGYDGPVYTERYQTVSIEDIMDAFEEHDAEEFDNVDWVAFKEYVLANNIGSYEYDW